MADGLDNYNAALDALVDEYFELEAEAKSKEAEHKQAQLALRDKKSAIQAFLTENGLLSESNQRRALLSISTRTTTKVDEEDLVPDAYVTETRRSFDMKAIGHLLRGGAVVPGCSLHTSAPILTIKPKENVS